MPSLGAIQLMEEAAYLDSLCEPPEYESRAAAYKRIRDSMPNRASLQPKKKKQMKIEKAVKNMSANFQGMPNEKCTYAQELAKLVYIHPNYSKAWEKLKKGATFVPRCEDDKFCPECYCQPCSARLLQQKLECDACTLDDIIRFEEGEHLEKLRRYYRAQMAKLQGKRFVNSQMKNNDAIPGCAKRLTAAIAAVEAKGEEAEDSILDTDSEEFCF